MTQFLIGLLFLSGLPICIFILPASWWPWSTFGWFIGFVALERSLHKLALQWRGRPAPGGISGIVVSTAIIIDDASASDGGEGGGDSGGDGGGD